MEKIKLGGIKIVEGRCYLSSSCRSGEDMLADICCRLAMEHTNLSLLTYLNRSANRGAGASICTEGKRSFSSYFLLKLDDGSTVMLEPEVSILSVFPHNERPEVLGIVLRSMAASSIQCYGFASSPSAMTVQISSADLRKTVDGLFGAFNLPSYESSLDWYAAYQGKEQVLKDIICSYQEQIIKVYGIVNRHNLDILQLSFPLRRLESFGVALQEMGEMGVRVPFIIGQSVMHEGLTVAFCMPSGQCEQVSKVLDLNLGEVETSRHGPVTALFLHGPHFGDRHGIANALAGSLQLASIKPVAVSCAVSSISLVIDAEDEERCIEALSTRFEIPGKLEANQAG